LRVRFLQANGLEKPVLIDQEVRMDFIERWLGVSPDGGNGTLEMLVLVVLAASALFVVSRRRLQLIVCRRQAK
jgi:hypothetical protein